MRTVIFAFFCLAFTRVLAQNPKLKISKIAPNLYKYTSYNVYKGNITDANAVYLVTKKGVVVIDAPWDSTQFQPFLDSIKAKHNQKVVLAIATHSHEDRAGGLGFFKAKGIKTYATAKTNKILLATKKPTAQFTFDSDTTFNIGGIKIQTSFVGEGHTKDNIIIWFEQAKLLYGGCLVKSIGSEDLGYIGEANVKQWPQSIKNLQKKYPDAKILIPGHGAGNKPDALKHTLELLEKAKP
ncbi:BlaB/IND/MUS family subclass B1 metallo-beta-lactamase [Pedobacter aquatilis]|uniref:BlaB/IND/MUS family subclass B1 metallo-beta-lactamase n=1 Tax=Pedobacter aquatilis TaxID=351343 RepID=UPI0025B43245|nr:BlaB/IND/MUS family subclass B1 metallo-beta-lactamase [Pedobacter aquatilis]MDN3587992.1 BlaB/IND/MUS family subclass B1 metallo-beta-lactamase [Pedobacter aquatilis]